MNLELTRRGVLGVAAFLLASLAILGYMLARLGAVRLPGAGGRSAVAVVSDAEGLPPQADVLVHGVQVGSVSAVEPTGVRTRITLALDRDAPALHRDATVRVGFKTPLGEPFVELDPGHATGRLAPGSALRPRSTVAIDDALAFLGPRGRADLRGLLAPLGQAAAAPRATAELSGALAALGPATDNLTRLLAELRAQRGDLTGIVGDGGSVLSTVAARSGALSGLVGDARTTLGAVAGERTALAGTLTRLPDLLRRSRATLLAARPLIADATPVAGAVAAAAPGLSAALRDLPAVSDAANRILGSADAIAATVPALLRQAGTLAAPASATLSRLGPVLADLVPVARYLGPRGNTIAAWFANTADLGSHGDAKGDWARFFVMFDPSTLLGLKAAAPPGNTYTAPGDAAHNAPYRPGDFPQLTPYSPALRQN